MKRDAIQPISAIDALTAGLESALRYPWPLAIPLVIDVLLWLMPRLSVAALLQRVYTAWEGLVRTVYSSTQLANMDEVIALGREVVTQVGESSNLALTLTGSWLAAPSALADVQVSRLKLISDGVLAPVGFGLKLPAIAPPPGHAPAFELSSMGATLGIIAGLWLLSQLIAVVYFRWTAYGLAHAAPHPAAEGVQVAKTGLFSLTRRFIGLGIVLSFMLFVFRLPLALAAALAYLSGGGGVSLLFMFSGGLVLWLTLWFLMVLFFASEALVLDGQPLWASLWQSMLLVRRNSMRVLGLAIVVNLILLGFRAVWGLIGQTALGAVVAIAGNAFLGTAMLYAIYIYYHSLRTQALGTQPKDEPGAPAA